MKLSEIDLSHAKLKPLEYLVRGKMSFISELEMEISQTDTSKEVKKLLAERIRRTEQQIFQITSLMKLVENQLPSPSSVFEVPSAEPKIEVKAAILKQALPEINSRSTPFRAIAIALGIAASISLAISVAVMNHSHTATVVSVRSPESVSYDASNEFRNESTVPSADLMRRLNANLDNALKANAKSILIQVYSKNFGNSLTTKNLNFHKRLTQNRANGVAKVMSKSIPANQGFKLIPKGMGVEKNGLGKRVVLTIEY
jgi:hypothetical protein